MFLFEVNSIKKWASIRFIIQSARGNYCISAHFYRGQGGEKIISPDLFSSGYLVSGFTSPCIADEVPEVHLSSSNLQLFLIFL